MKLINVLEDVLYEENTRNGIPKRLLEFSAKHKIQPYVFEYLRNRDADIDSLLEKELRRIENKYQNQVEFAEQINQDLNHPLVVFKGFSNSFLQTQYILKRESADLDVLYKEPEQFRNILLNKKFSEFKYNPDPESGHEFSCLDNSLSGMKIDLHHHIPIMAYPDDIHTVETSGDTTQSPATRVAAIGYEDILLNSIQIFGNVLIPNIHLSVLILCSSMFRDYIGRMDRLPYFKLIDLQETLLLLDDPMFDFAEFNKLVIRYKAFDSVNFVGKVTFELLGFDSFEFVDKKLRSYPQIQIWNFNSWFIPPSLKESILNIDVISLFRQMGAEILLVKNNVSKTYKCNLLQLVIKSTDNSDLDVSLKITLKDDLILSVEIENVSGISEKDLINFNFGSIKKTYFGSSSRRILFGAKEHQQERIEYDKKTRTLTLTLHLNNEEMRRIKCNNDIPLNLYIEKYENVIEYDFLCPIIIRELTDSDS